MNLLKRKQNWHFKGFSKLCLSLLTLFLIACGNSSGEHSLEPSASYEENDVAVEEAIVQTTQKRANSEKEQEQKIIKTGFIEFETANLESTYSSIKSLLSAYEGYIQTDESGKNYNRQFRNLTIRIPSKNFQSLVDSISTNVEVFDTKSISRRDVTEEFIDLTARLKAKRELEARYLQILNQAKNVKEILEVERELSKIREEIEAKQGRLEYLESQVSFSTLNINFYKSIRESGVTLSYGNKIINALKSGWYGISTVLLGVVTIWPLILVGLILAFFFRRWLKKTNKNTST